MGKLLGNTPSYQLYEWIKAEAKLGYGRIHDIMWTNAMFLPLKWVILDYF